MNSQNPSADPQKSVPPEYVPPDVIAPLVRECRFIEGVCMALRKTRMTANTFNRKQTVHLGGRRSQI